MATLRPFSAWPMFVQALVSCEGFHSPRPQGEFHGDEENSLQESLYWTCFKSELSVATSILILNISINVCLAGNFVWN
jgi:hypothetical protein